MYNMKKCVLFFVALFFTLALSAQIQDLYELSKGKMVYSKILFDKDYLWGYFYLFEMDKLKDSTKMEYFVLDKNLNKVYNGSFKSVSYNDNVFKNYFTKYDNCFLIANKLVLDISLYKLLSYESILIQNSNREIDLSNNTVSDECLYSFRKKQFLPVDTKILSLNERVDSLGYKILVDPIKSKDNNGFLVRKYNTKEYKNEHEICYFSSDKKFQWQYTFDSIVESVKFFRTKTHKTLQYLFMDNSKLYFMERTYDRKDKDINIQLIGLDINTGKKVNEYCIQNDTTLYSHSLNFRLLGDTIAFYGRYLNNPKIKKSKYSLGLYRILLDKNLHEIDKDYRTWSEVSTDEYKISAKVNINNMDNFLQQTSILILNDGSLVVSNQEYIKTSPSHAKDLYFITLDSDFKNSNITKVEMSKYFFYKTYSIDSYLFSQYMSNSNSVLICFENKLKINGKEETELVINTIKNRKVFTERISLTSSKKYAIYPRPAKDGYIMLNEFNEKDTYNQIRLEKLNN